MNPELLNGSTLAFIGDAVLSLWVREYLVSLGYTKANDLQKKSIIYVSANAQAKFMLSLLEDKFLSEEETQIYLRGRNHKSSSKAKNADVVSYRIATGFEALIGYWHLNQNETRLRQVWDRLKTTQ
jgi:ribonuclease-3 family protein